MNLMDLLKATGGGDRYIDNPQLLGAAETRSDGNNILGHIFGSSSQGGGLGSLGDLIGAVSGKGGLDDILGLARKFF